jgi:hypothetical protein
VVTFAMQKESLNWIDAIKYLLRLYNVDTSGIPDDPDLSIPQKEVSPVQVRMLRMRRNILELQGMVPFEVYRALCAAYMMIRIAMDRDVDVLESVIKLEEKLCQKFQR